MNVMDGFEPSANIHPPSHGVDDDAHAKRTVCAVRELRRSYGIVRALKGVSLNFIAGQVHAILGENGAGKSTLMKILAGAERADEGDVEIDGRLAHFTSVRDAARAGISIVFQELSLFPELDSLANLFAAREPTRVGLIDRKAMRREAQEVLDNIGLDVDLDRPVGQLSLHDQQLLEIAKALLERSRLIILDEPTSSLNAEATARLFAVIRRLRDQGVAVLFISHRLEEVFAVADTITVLRDGRHVSTRPTAQSTMRQVVREMIGHSPDVEARRIATGPAKRGGTTPNVRVTKARLRSRSEPFDIEVSPGEIVGLVGLEGAGHVQLMEAIFGVRPLAAGEITIRGMGHSPRSTTAAVALGIAMVPADRRTDGLMLNQDIVDNMSHVTAGVLGRLGFWLRQRSMIRATERRGREMNLTAASSTAVRALSGGNQQKVLIGRWLEADPEVLLLNDPTRGVDVGAKAEIYELVRRFAEQGRSVVFISTEHIEYEYLCGRVLVFYRDTVAGEVRGAAINEHSLITAVNTGSVYALDRATRSLMREAAASIGTAVHLIELRNGEVSVREAVGMEGAISEEGQAETVPALHATAGSRVLFAQLDDEQLDDVRARKAPIDDTSLEALDADLASVRSAGFALDEGPQGGNAASIAVPLPSTTGLVTALMVVCGANRLDAAEVQRIVALLADVSERIATLTGTVGDEPA
ncbi:MAG: ATP-binding cassette domain-containing protein [Actinobacteria bacterium]|nr:ATP-binding cassette domain-containing protein [Actinomycetota bacterium]